MSRWGRGHVRRPTRIYRRAARARAMAELMSSLHSLACRSPDLTGTAWVRGWWLSLTVDGQGDVIELAIDESERIPPRDETLVDIWAGLGLSVGERPGLGPVLRALDAGEVYRWVRPGATHG